MTPDTLVTFILTFNRQKAVERLARNLNKDEFYPYIMNNDPGSFEPWTVSNCKTSGLITNVLNSSESNSWCARSWNSIFLKALDKNDSVLCIQDDTDVAPGFGDWFLDAREKYDFIWGPAGDQFFYLTKEILQHVGWFDERYIGCYCGDAEFVRKVFLKAPDPSRISIVDTHNWGFIHNDCGLRDFVITTYESKVNSHPGYENQHWEFERKQLTNTIKHSQRLYKQKWGVDLDINAPNVYHGAQDSLIGEIDWYPWFSKKHGFNHLYDRQLDISTAT